MTDAIALFGRPLQVDCCIRSLSQGVSAAHIIDGRQPHSLLMELLTDEGVGTMITG
jgi:acetylglutamate kinase